MRAEHLFENTKDLEARGGQRALTALVERAIEHSRPLLIEAGTGIGKTLAYLVPAILSGKKVVISTGTRALQDQVFLREVPRAYQLLGREFNPDEVTLMKGLTNYLCKRRAESMTSSLDPRAVDLLAWSNETAHGDVAETDIPENDNVWRLLQSSSETRVGSGCRHYDTCFVTAMKRRAEDAQIVIVNHHLYFADLSLRTGPRGSYASVIPPHDVVIFDEAHQLEDVAMMFFGMQLSMARIEQLAKDAERLGLVKVPATMSLVRSLREHGDRLLRLVTETPEGEIVLPKAEMLAVRDASLALALTPAEGDEAQLFRRKASDLAHDLENVGQAKGQVRWIDRSGPHPIVRASPLTVAPILEEHLFGRIPTVVLASATLAGVDSAGAPSMTFIREQLGVPKDALETHLPSPFDVERRSILYVPDDLPEPSSPSFDEASAQRSLDLAELSRGGALILTTSFRGLNAATRVFRAKWRGELFIQGEGSKSRLLAAFRKSKNGVLLATLGFWEGVDVPGHALRLVVMDKMPFAVPTDPVLRARSREIEARGENPFMKLSVPAATILLKQGFGRLLRGKDDFGVVALLDRRLVDKPYGRKIRAALPKAPLVRDFQDLSRRWEALLVEVASPPRFEEAEAPLPSDFAAFE